MASSTQSSSNKSAKAGVLGRSAASGRFVMAPVSSKTTVSDKRIAAAVKSVLSKKK